MNKIKEFLLRNVKTVLAFILGIIISGTIVYAATILFSSDQVSYDNTASGINAATVQGAIDELYTKASNASIYREQICPGCVYRIGSDTKYNVNSTSASKTNENSKLTDGEYTTDYTTLGTDMFLGHVIDSNGYILSTYGCGINDGAFFCIKTVDSDQLSATYKPYFQEGKNIMNTIFQNCSAVGSAAYACTDDIRVQLSSRGSVRILYLDNRGCVTGVDGDSYCDFEYE